MRGELLDDSITAKIQMVKELIKHMFVKKDTLI